MTQKFGNRRQKAKAETRRVILETAYELFEQKGFEKTTMREMAARAGVGLGTIFQHFPDESMLAVAAFEDDMEAEMEEAFATLPQADLKTLLLHLAKQFYTLYSQRPQLFRVALNEVFLKHEETGEKIGNLISCAGSSTNTLPDWSRESAPNLGRYFREGGIRNGRIIRA